MASDQAEALKMLGIKKAKVLGISQGGMIAQYLAIDYPELVEKLVLAVTSSRQNSLSQDVVEKWIIMAEQKDYKSLMIDTAEKSYSEKYLSKYRPLYPILGKLGKPKDFSRFLIQAKSCITHNAYLELDTIACPTLIIGGECDKIVGVEASKELADKIKKSKLYIYSGLVHTVINYTKKYGTSRFSETPAHWIPISSACGKNWAGNRISKRYFVSVTVWKNAQHQKRQEPIYEAWH